MRVTFHPAAEIELYDAALYYESQRRGLGSTFLQAIETAMDEIRENPMASPRVQGVVRSKRVRRFPYSFVVYRILRSAGGYRKNVTRAVQFWRHGRTTVGYFFPHASSKASRARATPASVSAR